MKMVTYGKEMVGRVRWLHMERKWLKWRRIVTYGKEMVGKTKMVTYGDEVIKRGGTKGQEKVGRGRLSGMRTCWLRVLDLGGHVRIV